MADSLCRVGPILAFNLIILLSVLTDTCYADVRDRVMTDRYKKFVTSNPIDARFRPPPLTIGFQDYYDVSKISAGIQELIVTSCARMWAEVSGVSFTFVGGPGITAAQANVLISHVALPKNETDKVLGLTLDPENNAIPKSSTLKMSTVIEFQPCEMPKDKSSYKSTLCHELGHALNLAHTPDTEAIMFVSTEFFDGKVEARLNQDDINGIQAVYGTADGKTLVGGVKPKTVPADTAAKHACLASEIGIQASSTTPTPTTTTTTMTATTTTTRMTMAPSTMNPVPVHPPNNRRHWVYTRPGRREPRRRGQRGFGGRGGGKRGGFRLGGAGRRGGLRLGGGRGRDPRRGGAMRGRANKRPNINMAGRRRFGQSF